MSPSVFGAFIFVCFVVVFCIFFSLGEEYVENILLKLFSFSVLCGHKFGENMLKVTTLQLFVCVRVSSFLLKLKKGSE